MKGKFETRSYMVPIARILQESKEGVRLLTGLDRTGEALFNVLKFGKNSLRAWKNDRRVVIKPVDGSRVYEFHPWEKILTLCLLKTIRMCPYTIILRNWLPGRRTYGTAIIYGNNTGGFVKKVCRVAADFKQCSTYFKKIFNCSY